MPWGCFGIEELLDFSVPDVPSTLPSETEEDIGSFQQTGAEDKVFQQR